MKENEDELNLPLRRNIIQIIEPNKDVVGAQSTIFESNMKEKPVVNCYNDSTSKVEKKKKKSDNKKIERSMRKELE